MRAKALLQNLALFAVSILLAIVLVEVAARLWVAREAAPAKDPSRRIARYHATLGWDKPPGGHMRIGRGEYDVEIAINAHGLRGPDRDYAKPEGARRVLILGDSFAEGYYVDEDKSARAVLEGLLKGEPSCGNVEVVNGGTAGYSTDQEYLFFESEGKRYQSDVVLVFFYYNDLFFNTTGIGTGGKPKSYFDLDADRLVLRNTPVPGSDRLRWGGVRPFHGSIALRLLSIRVSDNPRLQAALAPLGLVEKTSATTNREFDVFGPNRPDVQEMWRRTAAILKALRVSVEAAGGRLAILYVPARVEANDAAWEEVRASFGLGGRWERARVRERLEDVGATLGIPVIDPTEALRRAEQPGRPAYFPRDGHWNEVGNAVAAHALEGPVRTLLGCPAP